MKERPILFSGPMVRAIIAGKKTQTRRIVTDRHFKRLGLEQCNGVVFTFEGPQWDGTFESKCAPWSPYGVPGDRLWVRETHFIESDGEGVVYRERGEFLNGWTKRGLKWRSPICMPRWASRITLEVVAVRVERLQDISAADLAAEGFPPDDQGPMRDGCRLTLEGRRQVFAGAWEEQNGPDSWDANPWVWVVEFKRLNNGGA